MKTDFQMKDCFSKLKQAIVAKWDTAMGKKLLKIKAHNSILRKRVKYMRKAAMQIQEKIQDATRAAVKDSFAEAFDMSSDEDSYMSEGIELSTVPMTFGNKL